MIEKVPEIVHLVRAMAGSSQAILAGASDGRLYILKMPGRTCGPHVLFNEAAGHELYRSFGLPVPDWTALSVSAWMIAGNPDCWRGSTEMSPDEGLCFGSRFLPGIYPKVRDLLPSSMFHTLRNREDFWLSWVIDVLARHSDRRQALFAVDANDSLTSVFIDQCHMFGGPEGLESPSLPRAQYYDCRIYGLPHPKLKQRLIDKLKRFDPENLQRKLLTLPEEWKTPTALKSACDALHRLSNVGLVQTIVERLLDTMAVRDDAYPATQERTAHRCSSGERTLPAPELGVLKSREVQC